MHDYPLSDYGFVLSDETLRTIGRQMIPNFNPYEGWTITDVIEELEDRGYEIQIVGNFSGGTYAITPDEMEFDYDMYTDETLYYIPLDRTPKMFDVAYKNMDEIVNEIKDKIGEYLPDNFSYENNLKHIVGTTWG